MRKMQKDSIIELAKLLQKAQEHVKNLLLQQEYASVLDLLQQCQQGAIQIGTSIEETEGEDFPSVKMLEQYCEYIYELFEMVRAMESEQKSEPDRLLDEVSELLVTLIRNMEESIEVRKQIVFLPYKASMWDSFESIWEAAQKDPVFDVSVVPIPYYDRNSDGTFKSEHYEGGLFPEYVKVMDYQTYPLEEIRPDVIYIHTPYDHCNYVTSVHPRFYSYELRKYTDMLVYVPYFASSGGMGDEQAFCSAYQYVDYMVIQSEEFKNYIDASVPREKILPFGSPKFDKTLRLCNDPPKPPLQWQEKMAGKKVYFYNTSISGMLADTRRFLMKMDYVFKCFREREDVCLLWRPHPLLESTFDSMRKEYRPVYDSLKRYFLGQNIGIYDDTPDIEKTIALCDAYIGDATSSVISLFGIAGKPIYILNNSIHRLPDKEDWRDEAIAPFFEGGSDQWQITQGNKLYVSPSNDYRYEYCCDLSEYAYGDYYQSVVELCGKVIVCPKNAQDILVIKDRNVAKKIELKKCVQRPGSFISALCAGRYLFLIPHKYPAIVRYDAVSDRVDYIEGYNEVFVRTADGQSRTGGACVWKDYVLLASPVDDRVLAIEVDTMKVQLLAAGVKKSGGCMTMIPDGACVWMLPIDGKTIGCWNPVEGKIKEYENVPEGFLCRRLPVGYEVDQRPYSSAVVTDKEVILAPYWGNMFVRLNKITGEVCEWKTEIPMTAAKEGGYARASFAGKIVRETKEGHFLYYSETAKGLYEVSVHTGKCRQIEVVYDEAEWIRQEPGFANYSQWLQYCAVENACHTLLDFLAGKRCGKAFDKEKQMEAFRRVAAGGDGKTGERVHRFISEKM